MTIFLLITSCLGFVSANPATEENVTNATNRYEMEVPSENKSEEDRIGEVVRSKERGNYNITFDDGYNGYCVNYGDSAAKYDDLFTVQNTSLVINHKTGEYVGNYIKTFFVEFYDIAVNDKVKTQYVIWAFTDDFHFEDHELVNEIKEKSLEKDIPDHGAIKRINNTTEAIFDFEGLDAHKDKYQNFFGYKITLRTIQDEILGVEPENNTTIPENNTTIPENNTTIPENNTTEQENNMTNITAQMGESDDNVTTLSEINNKTISQNLAKHATGNDILIIAAILIAGAIMIIKYRRD